jgi:hypothetical protein
VAATPFFDKNQRKTYRDPVEAGEDLVLQRRVVEESELGDNLD